jgi:hypothetical protein
MRDALTVWLILPLWAVAIVAGSLIWLVGIAQGILWLFGVSL